ncbi:MAG: 4-oxalocrotonate decarboxylase [Actinomycetota bacterium]|nr:4-oxalocrotonate decarboxylase [Actinomycetota bacterium]
MDPSGLADRIWDAVRTTTAISPLTEIYPELTVDSAYEIQEEIVARHLASGTGIAAAKLGLTSTAKQQQMNVSEPLYGWMTDEMRVVRAARVDDYIQPRAEPEVAFIIGKELEGPNVTTAEVIAATDAIAPALDILDSRFSGYRFTLADVTADNSSAAGFVLGEPVEPPRDLRVTGCVFEKNGELVATAAGASVMDHPAAAVAWFVRKLHERGKILPAGMTVLAGAWTAAVPIEPGDLLRASFDHIGSVELTAE